MTAIYQKSAPALRFKDSRGRNYPDWEDQKLKQIAKIYRGTGLPKSAIRLNGKFPCVLYGELFTKYTEIIKTVFSSTNLKTPVTSRYGDILMPTSDVTPSGLATASALLAEGVQLGGDINIIRLHKGICSIFMSYRINFHKKGIIRLVTGTTVKHIYAKDLYSINFSIPTALKEQQKIAAFLSSVDAKIEQLTKKRALLEQYKKGMMQKFFNQEIRFKDETGKNYPDWQLSKLAAIADIRKGKVADQNEIVSEGYPVIAGGRTSPYFYRSFTHKNVITVSASGAAAGYVSYHPYKIWASDCSVIQATNQSYTLFILHLLKHMQTRVYALQSGGAQPHVYPKDLNTLSVNIPTNTEEQRKIADFLSAIDSKIKLATRQIERAQAFKKGILQQMFI